MSDDLVRRLRIKAGVMEMGEPISWGSDTSLMREAADRIDQLKAENARLANALMEERLLHGNGQERDNAERER